MSQCYRTEDGALNERRYCSYWTDLASAWVRRLGGSDTAVNEFPAIFVACVLHADVSYRLQGDGVAAALGLSDGTGLRPVARWKDVLAGRASLRRSEKPAPLNNSGHNYVGHVNARGLADAERRPSCFSSSVAD